MRDTIQGSGFNAEGIEREFTCRNCNWEGVALGITNDYQSMLYATCPNCKDEMTIDLDAEREGDNWDNNDNDKDWD